MRIDGASKSNAAAGANIGDLMSRLDTGDVIRAKVIEITSDEAVLRLFDGTSLKAKLAEALDAKAGQTITLSVASKTEGTLVLETVKDFNARFDIKPDILKNILESLQLKPDNKNTEAAAGLLKAGLPVTREAIGKALQLMDGNKDMTADKAVFISSKAADSSQIDPKLAVRLLKGELKLGKLLVELQNALENVNENTGSEPSSPKSAGASSDTSRGFSGQPAASTRSGSGTADIPALNVQGKQTSGSPASSMGKAGAGPDIAGTGTGTEASNSLTADGGTRSARNSSFFSQENQEGPETISQEKVVPNASQAVLKDNAQDGLFALKDNKNGTPDSSAGVRAESDTDANSVEAGKKNSSALKTAGKLTDKLTDSDIRLLKDDDAAKMQADKDRSASDALPKIKDAIKDIFVGTDSDKLASELDANKLYKELDSRLDAVKNAVNAPGMQGAKADMIAGAANLLSDTLRLFDQLNAGGLMYYQIPVKVADNNTTAELYIMKKQRNGKKIDPGNTVMFVSLDTDHMGRVETLIDVKNKNIGIQLRTESQEIGDFIKEYTKDLYNGLSELGYKLTGIRFKTIDSAADPIMQEKLLEEMKQGYMGRVDFRV